MDYDYVKELDRYFCAHYSDYTKIGAIEGYKSPDLISIGRDGNITRKDSSLLRLCYQPECELLLARLKENLADTSFTFSFCFPGFTERFRSRKHSFAKVLPEILSHTRETTESAGRKLDIEPRFWDGIVKGRLLPEKNTILALGLVCRMSVRDVNTLLGSRGFELREDSVSDVVVGYLLTQKIFNGEMRDRCLAEYRLENFPIAAEGEENT